MNIENIRTKERPNIRNGGNFRGKTLGFKEMIASLKRTNANTVVGSISELDQPYYLAYLAFISVRYTRYICLLLFVIKYYLKTTFGPRSFLFAEFAECYLPLMFSQKALRSRLAEENAEWSW